MSEETKSLATAEESEITPAVESEITPAAEAEITPAAEGKITPAASTELAAEVVLEDEGAPELSLLQKAIRIGIALAIALVSIFVLSGIASSPDTYTTTIETLDEKKGNVTALAASAAAASTVISLLPDDIGNPIAVELADLSADFVVILAAILLMKYLLTLIGLASFALLIPLACGLYILGVVKPHLSSRVNMLALRLALLAVILMAVVPTSTFAANMIDETFETSMQLAEAPVEVEAEPEPEPAVEEEEEGFHFGKWLMGIPSAAAEKAEEVSDAAIDKASTTLNYYLEAFAVMIVTSCIVPILVLAAAVWLVGAVMGISTTAPLNAVKSRSWRKPMAEGRSKLLGGKKDKAQSAELAEGQGAE